jgi:redox-sensing transcriptional repressor
MPLDIPDVVIDRLPVYYRLLCDLHANGIAVVSSQELGDALGITPAQIRKDLSYFGRFGKQGRGYAVARLTEELRHILGLDRRWRVVLIGVGRLGTAIASYRGFDPQGFDIVAIYDANPEAVGTQLAGLTVHPAELLARDLDDRPADIGIVAVPADAAQDVIDTLVRAGVHAILNYAPIAAHVPPHVQVRHIDPVLALQGMTYHLRRYGADASPRA